MKVMAIDIGGTPIKILATSQQEPCEFESGSRLTPTMMVAGILKLSQDWKHDVVSVVYPEPVCHNDAISEPHNLGQGWIEFDYRTAFKRLVMLFLGLGPGLGSAIIGDGILEPLELAHQPCKKRRTHEGYVGLAGLKRLGQRKWRPQVTEIVKLLMVALEADYVVLGGGNARLPKRASTRKPGR